MPGENLKVCIFTRRNSNETQFPIRQYCLSLTPMTSTEARLAEKLGPFSEIFNVSHYISKIKTVKTFTIILRLVNWGKLMTITKWFSTYQRKVVKTFIFMSILYLMEHNFQKESIYMVLCTYVPDFMQKLRSVIKCCKLFLMHQKRQLKWLILTKIGDQILLLGSKRLFVHHQSYHNLDSGLFMPQNNHWNKYQNSCIKRWNYLFLV